MDTKSKFINPFVATSASAYDSQPNDDLLDGTDEDQEPYADSAYTEKTNGFSFT
ncbi:hypothetical protein [Mariniflexile sp.]|uniref:hypothetical protein n=1 Tax=Mariniflexile sp. TaxID=1979402 RepID=UPI0040475585